MNLPLPYPFEREYMQLALVAGLAVGLAAPLIGTFLVQKRLSLLGDGVGHLAFAGLAAGILLGVWPVAAALVVSVAGAVAIEWLRSRGRASGDLALALFFYSGIAAGVVLLGLAGSLDASVFGFLFGQVLTVTPADAAAVVALGVLVVGVLVAVGRALFGVILDEEAARVAGLPVDALNALLAALAAATIVAAMRVVGLLLVAALMVLPVAAAQQVARSFRSTLTAAAGVGVVSVVVGLGGSRVAGTASGASIVLVAALAFVVAALASALRRRRGLGLPTTSAIASHR